jgi:membrane protein
MDRKSILEMLLIIEMLKDTFSDWKEDNALMLAAALAYYTIFALAPLLVIIIAIAGFVFGQEAARGQIVAQTQGLIGDQSASIMQVIIENAGKSGKGILATVVGIITIIVGATGIFSMLQGTLNTIWDVKPRASRGILGIIKGRIPSFMMVLGAGFLLLASLAISAGITVLGPYLAGLMSNYILLQSVNVIASFLAITFVFALVYKIIPDIDIAWGDVWIGAAITSLLFSLGKFLMGLYLEHSAIESIFGAAGSLVVLLLWIYYSANILLLGAEFTHVYAKTRESRMIPKSEQFL